MDTISNELAGMLFGNEGLMKSFNKDSYADAFNEYYEKYSYVLDEIDSGFAQSENGEAYLKSIAEGFTEYAHNEEQKLKKRNDRDHFLVDHNSVLTVYLLPALAQRGSEACEKLADMIVGSWNNVFRRYTISRGTFAEIDGGFKRKLCYITTAVCESLGKSDDCYELKILRDYRDGYLMGSKDGEEVVRTYYDIAPTIVNRINKRNDSDRIYSGIFNRYISPCISLIEEDKKEECRELYSRMVYSLREEYMNKDRG